ncbi:tyrosine-type recombinase/integrase [Neisseria gonorrhoeae]
MAAHNKLTQKQIEAAKADGKQSKLADGGGLYLLLHPNGSKYWRMRYRHGGCEKTLALGVYPAVSLKQARELARAARAQTAAGIDPVAEHHRTRPGSGRSLPEIARAWYGSRQGQRADNTLEGDRRSLAYLTDYYKDNTDINDITTACVSKFIEHLNRINIPACARRTVQILAQIWDYAVQRGIITDERRNPATTARPLLNTSKPKPQPHIRPDELPDFYRTLQTAHDLHPYARPLLLLAALTVPRPSALLSARWQDIDLTARLWHIPAADMKTKHPFTVPLSDWAVEILRELHTQTGDNIHLFPGIRPRRKPAPPSRPHQHQIRPQRHPTTGL